MAKQEIHTTVYICDRDKSEHDKDGIKVRYLDLDGKHFALDLGPPAAEDFDASIADRDDALKRLGEFAVLVKPSVKGRKSAGTAKSGKPATARVATPKPAAARNPDSSAIRAWATEQGITIGPRGRIPAAVIESYNKAH
jgi:hypothetical protein